MGGIIPFYPGDIVGIRSARLAAIVELAMGAIITVDAEQTIVNFNKAAEKMFGYAQEDIVGRELDMLIPERFRRVHARHIGDFKAPGIVSRVMGRSSARSVLSARRAGWRRNGLGVSASGAKGTVVARPRASLRGAQPPFPVPPAKVRIPPF